MDSSANTLPRSRAHTFPAEPEFNKVSLQQKLPARPIFL
jgi:hypothetical protein